jgi:hypothetical protein
VSGEQNSAENHNSVQSGKERRKKEGEAMNLIYDEL